MSAFYLICLCSKKHNFAGIWTLSLVICVRGHTYHGETHITVTPPQENLKTMYGKKKKKNVNFTEIF